MRTYKPCYCKMMPCVHHHEHRRGVEYLISDYQALPEQLEAEIRALDAAIVRLLAERDELRQALRDRARLREGQHVEHA